MLMENVSCLIDPTSSFAKGFYNLDDNFSEYYHFNLNEMLSKTGLIVTGACVGQTRCNPGFFLSFFLLF